MSTKITIEEISDLNPEAMMADGFDKAILGMCVQFGTAPLVAYDYEKCVNILIKRDGMTKQEAVDYMRRFDKSALIIMKNPYVPL